MDKKAELSSMKKSAAAVRVVAYLLVVMLVFSTISLMCSVPAPIAASPEKGVVDLTGIDFDKEIITIQNMYFDMYPGIFYMPEDFAYERVDMQAISYGDPVGSGDYGTFRVRLILPQGEMYTIAGRSASVAQRLFINGEEYVPIGVTGTSAKDVVPKSIRYMECFKPESDITEIIFHHSSFLHSDGGSFFSLEIGFLRNMVRAENLRLFRVTVTFAALITAMLFFFGLLLFFSNSRYLLWFSLTCVCVAIRGMLVEDKNIMLLLPDLSWYHAIRMEYIMTSGTALFSALYLNDLFPKVVNKWAVRCFTAFCIFSSLFVCVTQPVVFTRFAVFIYAACIVFFVGQLLVIIISALRGKLSSPLSAVEQSILLLGLCVYVLMSIVGIYAHSKSFLLFGLDYPQVGLMLFLFINILSLSLGFSRTERDLDALRQVAREMQETNHMLERLDQLRTHFITNISHEIRTPLTVVDGFAQYTVMQINEDAVGDDTLENLKIISNEANRLSQFAEDLLHVSAEMAWERRMVSVEAVIERAAASGRAILAKNNNRLEIQLKSGLPSVRVNGDMIHQVLLNLIVNANNHTHGGVIILSGAVNGNMVEITVSDNGNGIDPKLLPLVFNRRVSGSGGAGLGLAICKEVIDLHNGRIEIKSTLGTGTQVTFMLPG